MKYKLPLRSYGVIPVYSPGYRPWIRQWWAYWLNPMTHWHAWSTVYQRGRRGWADSDCWSLDWYLSSWMGDALHHLHTESITLDCSTLKGKRKYLQMIDAWDSAKHVQWNCDCYSQDGHDEKHVRHFKKNIQVWVKEFFTLWW